MANNNLSTRGLVSLLGDMRKTNNFIVHIDDVTKDGNSLDLIIQRAFLPKVSINPIELRHGNDAIKFAGQATWEGGQIVILDTLSRNELDALLSWAQKVYNPDADGGATIGVASEYKKNGTITEYASDGRYQRRWKVKGMWPSDIDLGTLDAENANTKELSFTIQIDPGTYIPEYADDDDTAWSD
jgi:hypothetical protein